MEGHETVHSVVGPIAHSAAGRPHLGTTKICDEERELTRNVDLRLFLTSVLREEPWNYDPKVIPIPWRPQEEEETRKKSKSGGLNLGFFKCDGNVRCITIGPFLLCSH